MDDFTEIIEYDDSDIFYELLSAGELHVGMDVFVAHRDKANSLIGSINNWLNIQPPHKQDELSDDVADIWAEIDEFDPNSLSKYAFIGAVLEGKIGETHYRNDGSFCLHAVLAYSMYSLILSVIIRKHEIQIIARDMPLYPKLDLWFIKGFFRDSLKNLDGDCTPDEPESMTYVEPPPIDTVIERFEKRVPVYEAFRSKVVSKCEVCKALDEACRVERAKNDKT